ncbi:hypothetical protein [Psittacicella gerlachiana]|uniref:Uncharacterized protein n=1 Tax=Psittacicella gerlachiana TaxID=2028574 RepID=A0A3A1YJY0_9GAMM|nr:hypothetical protein [Psittacicella gerlachiana]RIY37891.1 hypothetical protein CKF59_01280 [Psittacicella gerlachiana]
MQQHQEIEQGKEVIGEASSTYGGMDYTSPHQQQLQQNIGSKFLLICILGIVSMTMPISNDALIPAIVSLRDFFPS